MIASVEKAKTPVQAITANPEPPTIFVSTTPAILLLVEGKPVLAPIDGITLEYVVNTNWDLFYDKTDFYLLNGKTWLKSKELSGPWAVTTKIPADMGKLPKDQNWGEVLKAVPPAGGGPTGTKVMFTEKPAELMLFNGKPVYAKIPGTNLS